MYTAVINPWYESAGVICAARWDMMQSELMIPGLASKLLHYATWGDQYLQQGVECSLVLENAVLCQRGHLELIYILTLKRAT